MNAVWAKSSLSFSNGTTICRYGTSGATAEAVEFAVSYAAEESVPLRRREPQDRSRGVPAVADADRAAGQARHLDAVAVGVTQRTLDPVRTWSWPFEWT